MDTNVYEDVYKSLLRWCPPLGFEPPWGSLTPDAACRGPVDKPAKALAALRKRFAEERLLAAGVIDLAPDGCCRVSPELTNPVGAVIALRPRPEGPPRYLLTARGCLPRARWPIDVVLQDAWTVRRLLRVGVLFAAMRIWEVALLRAAGLPATLATGISRLGTYRLGQLDGRFGCQDFVPPRGPPAAAGEDGGPNAAGGAPPRWPGRSGVTLALLGWSPLALTPEPSPALAHAVAHLAAARRHLGLPLEGVTAWRLSPRDIDNLRFRLRFRDPRLVRELLQERADSLVDFERLAGPAAPGQGPPEAGYVAARAELLAALADDRAAGHQAHRVRRAMRIYEEMVQRDLIGPLEEWALQSDDPVVRNAGTQLAAVCGLLHQMSPLLADLQAGRFERARGGDADLVPGKTLTHYLTLTARLGSLMRDLGQWMKM
jgi:hypothetical protein